MSMAFDDDADFPSDPFLALRQANAIFGDEGNSFRNMNKGVTPVFFTEFVPNPRKSEAEGRPICDEVELCKLLVAGDPQNVHVEPVTDMTKRRFPAQYAAWKAEHKDKLIDGTPLKQWPAIPPIKVAELEALNVFSVEGLAGLPDASLGRGFDLREWRAKALAWLESAKDGAAVMRYAAENERMKDDIAELKRQFLSLAEQVEQVAQLVKTPVAG